MNSITSIFTRSHSPEARARRRDASQATREVAANIRRRARSRGLDPLSLARTAGITRWRMFWLWTGVHVMITDMFRAQRALGMTVDDLFAGTRGASK
ncbi:hypothetical protein [Curtobacterium sp. ISL-83]|uniref:hypothetical protein n=1 Tax=Curtobacterium sp. ISL-83 TaxID=2819145 RepID=UPI001BEA35B8|nr:hypothetical protein [Curtobacterium sp. ISL-83]MBT2503007.1 hypothetical protein [Curtobacterium sp. ISL-83]